MTTQTSIVAQQVRLRQWAEQVQDCRNRPVEMDVETWCSQNNITKANYYYRLCRVRESRLEQVSEIIARHLKTLRYAGKCLFLSWITHLGTRSFSGFSDV